MFAVSTMRKANAILEYGILLFIVIGAVAGIHYFLKRHIQARVRREARSEGLVQGLSADPGPGQGLEWGSSITIIPRSKTTFDRHEEVGGDVTTRVVTESSQITLQAPVPSIRGWSAMEHKGSALHVQDAPTAAPTPDYPDLEYKDWEDQKWPKH